MNYPNDGNVIMVPNHEKRGDYYVNPSLSQLKDDLVKKMIDKQVFLMQPKHQNHLP